jgi:hypothetical protein
VTGLAVVVVEDGTLSGAAEEIPFREFDFLSVTLLNLDKCWPGSFGDSIMSGFVDAELVSDFFVLLTVVFAHDVISPLFEGFSGFLKEFFKINEHLVYWC